LECSVIAKQPGKNNYNENHVVFERLLIQKNSTEEKHVGTVLFWAFRKPLYPHDILSPKTTTKKFTVASQI